jgi:hypothetical protein
MLALGYFVTDKFWLSKGQVGARRPSTSKANPTTSLLLRIGRSDGCEQRDHRNI